MATRVTRGAVALLAAAALLSTAACTGDSSAPTPSAPTSTTPTPERLTFGVVGPKAQTEAFAATVNAWNLQPEHIHVELKSWATEGAMRAAIEDGAPVPDVFMASRTNLAWLMEEGYTQPVDELLDERGVEFGDNYSRDALEALSTDEHLQCMPYGVTPQVIFYNKDLVRFGRMQKRGLDAPNRDSTSWSFEQFAAAADFASRPALGSKGVHIDPSIEGLSPFVQSGGGTVFDDPAQPTTTTFSSDGSRGALEQTLELLRNPQVTLDQAELDEASPLKWFVDGKLGMIAGDRSLVPTLRAVKGLRFDILPMPRLGGAATVGDVTGLCMSATTSSPSLAADFMTHEISADSVGVVASAGYLQPANVEVAFTDDFLQPGRRPHHATLFNTSVRSMAEPPLIDTLAQLEDTVAEPLQELVYGVGALDLDALTSEVDDLSRTVLDPESVSESPSPTESSSDSPSESPSE